MIDHYRTIDTPGHGDYREKGSKFLAYTRCVSTAEEVDHALAEIKSIHPKSRHICYAYKIGIDDNNYRANDDGEPSGSAGKPILGRIHSADLTNTLVAVVRYFGGTKLGVSGLINAYKTAAEEAIEDSSIIKKIVCDTIELTFDYEHMGSILNVLKSTRGTISNKDFGAVPKVSVEVRKSETADFLTTFKAKVLGISTDQVTEDTKIDYCTIDIT